MANILREVLNANAMSLTIFCGGMSKVGIGVTGTWTGTVSFLASTDGVNFNAVTVTPFASGTGVQSATGNGSWELPVQNYVAVRVTFSQTTGSATVILAASLDASYQDAFLAASSHFVSQNVAAGAANTVTQPAQANRAWRLRTLTIGFSVAPAAAVDLQIKDGASTVLWETYIPKDTPVGDYQVKLPADPNVPGLSGGGIVGTPGNAMTVALAAPGGSVVSTVNCEFVPA